MQCANDYHLCYLVLLATSFSIICLLILLDDHLPKTTCHLQMLSFVHLGESRHSTNGTAAVYIWSLPPGCSHRMLISHCHTLHAVYQKPDKKMQADEIPQDSQPPQWVPLQKLHCGCSRRVQGPAQHRGSLSHASVPLKVLLALTRPLRSFNASKSMTVLCLPQGIAASVTNSSACAPLCAEGM